MCDALFGRVALIAPLIASPGIGDHRFGMNNLRLKGGDERIFRLNDNVVRFPLKFEADSEFLGHRAPLDQKHRRSGTRE